MEILEDIAPYLVALCALVATLVAIAHAVITKPDPRSAAGWVGVVLVAPLLGAGLYAMLGINRIRRRASLLRGKAVGPLGIEADADTVRAVLPEEVSHMGRLAKLVSGATGRPLLAGNRIVPLVDGDEAYPVMLAAIQGAQRSVALCTYIFDNDAVGKQFIDALSDAVERGVEVRVLVDSVGLRYSWPFTVFRELRRRNVRVSRFSHTVMPWRWPYFNLRTHRKVLVVDGYVGFAGGMNIRHGHVLSDDPKGPIRDVQFEVRGPVVSQLMESFAEDWHFTEGETLEGDTWFPRVEGAGPALARTITDGPDEDYEVLRWCLIGALAVADHRVRVVTPYFLPDAGLTTALEMAAMRGVEVELLLPAKSNLRLVQWASRTHLAPLIERGCKVILTPPPFDHAKLVVVDRAWILFGSANWDDRSLRLNFELNVECYDPGLAEQVDELIQERIDRGRRLTMRELTSRRLPARFRDGVARLFTPYL